ncbi:MAG: 7-cyano-7-deazaguanine synthase [Candidatus Altiarchaeota archaeon]
MKLAALISGGIDSPVAAYLMLAKGHDIVAIHFDNSAYTDSRTLNNFHELVRQLERKTSRTILKLVIPFGASYSAFLRKNRKFQCVLCKRMMLRLAERIAKDKGLEGILTGESLGQVASQTLSNLKAIEAAVSIPVVRPLIGFDKEDIIEVAKEIGTYEISIRPGLCCGLVPNKPATKADSAFIKSMEEALDISRLVEESLSKIA